MKDPEISGCQPTVNEEDQQMGYCLNEVHVPPVDTRDWFGRPRFFPANLKYFTYPGIVKANKCIHW